MTNTLCLLIYTPLLASAVILLFTILRMPKTDYVKCCAWFYGILIGWICCEMLYYALSDLRVLRFVFDFKLLFISGLAVAMFYTFANFFRLGRVFPKWLLYVLLIVPVVTGILAVTSTHHSLLMTDFRVVATEPLMMIERSRGIWFDFNVLYCELLAVAIMVFLLLNLRNLPSAHKKGAFFLVLCVIFYYSCTAIETLRLDANFFFSTIDFNLVGASLGGIFCYVATLSRGRLDYAYIEKRDVFNYLDDGVFILNESGQLLDMNDTARSLMRLLQDDFGKENMDMFLQRMKRRGKIDIWDTPDGAQCISVLVAHHPAFFQIQTRPFQYGGNPAAGNYMLLKNITNEQLMIDRLQSLAGVDALTGIANRYQYQQLLRELDVRENLPLSIIIGDLNNLKLINDAFGHAKGDEVLCRAAAVLQENCPMNGFAARIGGDEFAVLLPNYEQRRAQILIHAIKESLLADEDDLPLSIAFGSATKTEESQNINSLINAADMRMYVEKAGGKGEAEGGGAHE